MSGLARALFRRFDEVRCAELQRLRRKIAPLSEADRAQVDVLTAQVLRGIAARAAAALEADGGERLGPVVAELFRLAHPSGVEEGSS